MESKKLLIKNIKGLYLAQENIAAPLKGSSMHNLPLIKNAFLAIEDDLIVGYGSMDDWEGISNWNNLEIIDADDQFVLPTFCDSHSHLVFAKSREGEFEDRINGLSYEEIAAKGGGILNSAKALADKSEEQLYLEAKERLIALV